ncbi:MAG: glutamate--cysteine ligase [Candidatus Omnitrophota bacterium]
MTNQTATKNPLDSMNVCPFLVGRIEKKQLAIHRWLESHEQTKELPLYSSVDIRNAGFKVAVVDTNLFPAGFNNLCEHGLLDSVKFIKSAIQKRVPACRDILIVAEEHTRNTWYLENVRILQQIVQQAGFNATVATFLTVQPEFCQNANYVELDTATGHTLKIHCFRKILESFASGRRKYDLIILNNDLTTGIPDILKDSEIPIYPSMHAGWHSRLKSRHFEHTRDLINEFAGILGLDPWLFSCHFAVVSGINVHNDSDREKLMDTASGLFRKITDKYREHHIPERPFIFLKADAGTYGMGVVPIEDPNDILLFNRKKRNQLYKGKGAKIIDHFLLQEGVPTIHQIDQEVSELCIYQIENNFLGGFYRSHPQKGQRDNLNSQGMEIKKMCPHSADYGNDDVHANVNIFDIYRILARIAGIAAYREVEQLEADKK